jgi:hypothetical protein
MMQRPPDEDDPTSEEEVPEFDGTHTDQLNDTYRLRIVAASESANGAVDFDDRGRAGNRGIMVPPSRLSAPRC